MKTTILAFLLLFSCGVLSAQCPEGSVYLSSQFEVDTFGANWPNCETIAGDLHLGKYDQLANIDNLLAMSNICRVEGSLYIRSNFFLENLHGLENLQFIGKHFEISENQRLVSLEGLDQLEVVGDSLVVFENDALRSFNGLEQLDTIRGNLSIYNNNSLLNCEGLNSLRFVGNDLGIYDCEALINLDGLNHLTSIGGDFTLLATYRLVDLHGLESLDSIHGGLAIFYTFDLTTLAGLESLKYAKYLVVKGNDYLANFKGLEQLTVDKLILILNNQHLEDISGLKLFDGFKGELTIHRSALENLSALSGLHSLASLTIYENFNLTSLAGLENLTSIDSSIYIWYNESLSDISALNHPITFKGERLTISENASLSDCAVEALCNWISRPDAIDVMIINQNNAGCNYVWEIEEPCMDKGLLEPYVLLWPNPFSDRLDVFVNVPYEEATLRIWDVSGRFLMQDKFIRNWNFDLAFLSAGVYFVEIQVDGHKFTNKMLKI